MSKVLEKSRNSCALQGAVKTISEIEGFAPIVHSTAGCVIQQAIGDKVSCYSGFDIPSTNVIEKQVIFGGGSRLREQIKNTVKVMEADLYVVLSGCAPELVGDDVITMANEAQEQGEPVIYFKAPGFKGKFHFGYEGVLNSIINQLPAVTKMSTEKQDNLVNVFGIIPSQDICWRGNLEELRRILESIGLKVNTLLGFGQGIERWKEVPEASLNLVFSKWGVSVAENLQKKYEIPFLSFNSIPIGAEATINFIKKVSNIIKVDTERTEKFIFEEKKKEEYFLANILNLYVDYNFQRSIGIVGDESFINGISNFLFTTLGLNTKVRIATDPIKDENEYSEEDLHHADDLTEIEEILKDNHVELILGSSLEKDIAEELSIPLQVISFPEADRIILNKSYLGFNGGINLLEDLSTAILNYERLRKQKLTNDIKSLIGK